MVKKIGAAGEPGRSARDRTLETLRRRIVTLELPPGTTLSENELAAELGVSRTPVRESLILLRQEGLVQVFPQAGSCVSLVDVQRVAEAQFIREAIECASLVDVGDLTPAQANLLRDQLATQDHAPDAEAFFKADEEFHRTLLGLAGHESAWGSVNAAKVHLDRARRLSLIDTRPLSTLVAQHAAVVEALVTGDRDGALTALRSHLRAVFDDVEQIRSRSPQLFSDGREARLTRRSVVALG